MNKFSFLVYWKGNYRWELISVKIRILAKRIIFKKTKPHSKLQTVNISTILWICVTKFTSMTWRSDPCFYFYLVSHKTQQERENLVFPASQKETIASAVNLHLNSRGEEQQHADCHLMSAHGKKKSFFSLCVSEENNPFATKLLKICYAYNKRSDFRLWGRFSSLMGKAIK